MQPDDLTPVLMAQLFDATSAAIIVVDAEQRIVRFNGSAESIFGYNERELLGKPLETLIPERFAQVHRKHVHAFGASAEQSRSMGERRAVAGRRKDGSEFPASAGITKLVHEHRELFAVILTDSSERHRMEAEARKYSEENAIARERNRLARDLHDAVSQTLFSASLIADVLPRLWTKDPAEGLRRLDELKSLNRGALAEMRMLLLELRPTALIDATLSDLLKQQVLAASGRSGIRFELTIDPRLEGVKLESDRQIAFYRISQETINNIIKHSGATRAEIVLRTLHPTDCKHTLELAISDNGCGFDDVTASAEHLGLRIIRERAHEIAADVSIVSSPNHGTKVVIHSTNP